VARGTDCHDEHDELPQGPGIEKAERSHRAVGGQGQDDERRGRQEQSVVDLLLGERPPDETVDPRSREKEKGYDDGDSRGERRLANREGAEEERGQQRDLGREAGIASPGFRVGDRREAPDDQCRDDQSELSADGQADAPCERDDRERPDARRLPSRPGPLTPLALGTDEQADSERDRQAQREHFRCGQGHRMPRLFRAGAFGT
jgi:hypothetical protein